MGYVGELGSKRETYANFGFYSTFRKIEHLCPRLAIETHMVVKLATCGSQNGGHLGIKMADSDSQNGGHVVIKMLDTWGSKWRIVILKCWTRGDQSGG